jgi:hypothetical protein
LKDRFSKRELSFPTCCGRTAGAYFEWPHRFFALTPAACRNFRQRQLSKNASRQFRPVADRRIPPLQTFRSLRDHLIGAQHDRVRNLDAEPKRCMRVTAKPTARHPIG